MDSSQPDRSYVPQFSGTERLVRLAATTDGIFLIGEDDNKPIADLHSLSQEDLQKIPHGLEPYVFVHLRMRSGENVSCIIAGAEKQNFGSMRAYYWRMTKRFVMSECESARTYGYREPSIPGIGPLFPLTKARYNAWMVWDMAMREAGSIQNMRENRIPEPNAFYQAVGREKYGDFVSDSGQDGFDFGYAMVLAVQSEDPILEAYAYRCFKRFIWNPGEEPSELRENDVLTTSYL